MRSSEVKRELRDAGMRATPARVAVLEVLRASGSPLTHSDVVDRLEGRGFDRATVFRNLNTLVDNGFAQRSDHGDHVWRFESVATTTGGEVHEHPHFLCTECGDVQCVPGVQLRVPNQVATVPRSVHRHSIEIQLRGLCDRCLDP